MFLSKARALILVSLLFSTLLLAPLTAPARAFDWPGFRGPGQSGATLAPGLFEGETIGLDQAWKVRIGSGYSGIATAGDVVFTMSAAGESDVILAVDLERGEELWRHTLGRRTPGHDGSEDGPSSTPATDGKRVFAVSTTARLFALDATSGRELWSVDLTEQNGVQVPLYDYAASPLVIGEIVVVTAPGSKAGSLAAFDRGTGEHRWSAAPGAAEYQSPVAANLLGEAQILIWQNERLVSVALDGRSLWSLEFGPNEEGTPVIVGDDRVLLQGPRSSALFRVERQEGATVATEIWQSRHLKGSMTAPVYHDGHIYGFDGKFLSCIDASDGERVWKSRPPGGNGLILVQDRLVVFAADGHVVLVKASPDGYQEETRLAATDRESLTWPSFAAGKILVRDATHLAAISVTDRPTEVTVTETIPTLFEGSQFTEFVGRVEASDNKQLLIDHFFRSHDRFPIVEGDLIHFVYRGNASDVAVLSPVWDPQKDFPFEQIEGTNFFYRSMRLEPMTRLEYSFRVDLDSVGPDPLNPRTVERYPGVFASESVPPGWQDPAHLAPYEGGSPGRIETFTLDGNSQSASQSASDDPDNEAPEIQIYLPAGAAATGLVVALGGDLLAPLGQLRNSLDHLIGQTVAPIAVAFIPPGSPLWFLEADGRATPELARRLSQEIVPEIERRYGLDLPRERVAVLGVDTWACASLYAGLTESETFGHALVIDYAGTFGLAEEFEALLSQPAPKSSAADIYLTWPRHGYVMTDRLIGHEEAEKLDHQLTERGYQTRGGMRLDSTGWGAYKKMIQEALEATFPD